MNMDYSVRNTTLLTRLHLQYKRSKDYHVQKRKKMVLTSGEVALFNP